jgi:hypothetical protein
MDSIISTAKIFIRVAYNGDGCYISNLTSTSVTFNTNLKLSNQSTCSFIYSYVDNMYLNFLVPIGSTPTINVGPGKDIPLNQSVDNLIPGETYKWYLKINDDRYTCVPFTTSTNISNLHLFTYPLEVGNRWEYYYYYWTIASAPRYTSGVHTLKIVSKEIFADTTMYNLICIRQDTSYSSLGISPKTVDTNSFSIVMTKYYTQCNWISAVHNQLVSYPKRPIRLSKYINSSLNYTEIGNARYYHDIGLQFIHSNVGSGTHGHTIENMDLLTFTKNTFK